ncbi:MAG: DUF4440 domain-containing protein [Gemmatimonadetes bacterium]|nr:nuclear transport factor 2 family protein [Gemmatimonadota bacterium]NIR79219.1 nuclear transport factor 2 family protein [Gemmatimonadota bacterium]NIT87880.1 nuclear transport factor 2 family protein [Gemmatimonadota bacterium]NIU31735.1 nuclear transport factor 2 family protein [Gemmatimonadota bacterium]NIU36352.1 DUF4440 domain-containing protein [Gemmatimonadota bacterium]
MRSTVGFGERRWLLAVGLALGALLAPSACAPDGGEPDRAARPDASVLLEADRAFAAAVAEGGSEAWASWFAEDGALVREGVGEIRGRAAVGEASRFLDDPGTKLRWEPRRGELAASGELGWTTGDYTIESAGPDGEVRRGQGVYVTIWRRQDDGAWRVVIDLGNPTEPAP